MTDGLITVAELAQRFRKPAQLRWAKARMRSLRHINVVGELFTTEEWLAQWLAAESFPAMNWPPKSPVYDPLEEVVLGRVMQLVGTMAAAGKLRVLS